LGNKKLGYNKVGELLRGKCRLFFATACETGKENRKRDNYFRKALSGKAKYFIGPRTDIKSENVIMFSILFL